MSASRPASIGVVVRCAFSARPGETLFTAQLRCKGCNKSMLVVAKMADFQEARDRHERDFGFPCGHDAPVICSDCYEAAVRSLSPLRN
ncbi:MAG TPA: hypothetical protein VFQ05_00230 [Candidatus Eisenbacteria bacterium]|nr:hypothetical protein [Candidatus Eisenbacteria bacterium]